MSRVSQMVGSTVGKKVIAGVTGAMLIGFVVMHLLGNFLLFAGEDAFNAYAAGLESIPGFPLIELSLVAIFLIHIGATVSLVMANRKARPVGYDKAAAPKKMSSGWMIISGSIVLVFLVTHLLNIRFNDDRLDPAMGVFKVTMDTLSNPIFAGLYIVGVILLGFHLRHGIHSFLRTLGYSDAERLPAIEKVAAAVSALITLGFVSLPIYALLQ